ncbi:MAG: M12 family metallo-peptidase [Phycisphaerales bacterium]
MFKRTLSVVAVALAAACAIADSVPDREALIEDLTLRSLDSIPRGGELLVTGLQISGRPVELDLERFSVMAPDGRIVIAGAGGEREAEAPIALFRGWVASDPESTAVLAVTPWWTQGVVSTAHETYYISTGPAVENGHGTLLVTAASDVPRDDAVPGCGLVAPADIEPVRRSSGAGAARSGPPPCRTARVALDTDFSYTQRVGGDALEAAAYAMLLTAAGSEIYQRDLNVRLAVSYLRVWEDNSDPYPASGDSLTQFEDHWRVNQIHVDRDFAMLLTGRTNLPYGGVAYLDALCSDFRGFGVVGYVRGSFRIRSLISTRATRI